MSAFQAARVGDNTEHVLLTGRLAVEWAMEVQEVILQTHGQENHVVAGHGIIAAGFLLHQTAAPQVVEKTRDGKVQKPTFPPSAWKSRKSAQDSPFPRTSAGLVNSRNRTYRVLEEPDTLICYGLVLISAFKRAVSPIPDSRVVQDLG